MGKKKADINMETFDVTNQIFRQKTETHAVFTLGKNEKVAMAEEAGQMQQDAFDLEDKTKRFKKAQDDKIKSLRAEMSILLDRIHKGEEERKIECLAEYDYTNFKVSYINMATGELVKETDMDEFTMNNVPPELNPDQGNFENNPTVTNEAKQAEAIDGTKGPGNEVDALNAGVDLDKSSEETLEPAKGPAPLAESMTPAPEINPPMPTEQIPASVEIVATPPPTVADVPQVPVPQAVPPQPIPTTQQVAQGAPPVVQPQVPLAPPPIPPQPAQNLGSFDQAFSN